MRLHLSIFAASLCVPPLLGCQTIIGADFESAKLAPSQSACELATPPVRPAHFSSAADAVDFTVVIDRLDFGDTTPDAGKSRPVGYDMDGLCSEMDGPLACKPYSWLDTNAEDGPGGRDDAVGHLLKEQKSLFGISLIGSEEESGDLVCEV